MPGRRCRPRRPEGGLAPSEPSLYGRAGRRSGGPLLLSDDPPTPLPEVPPDGTSKITQPAARKATHSPSRARPSRSRDRRRRMRRRARRPRARAPGDVASFRAGGQPALPRGHHRPRRARSGRRWTTLAKLFPAYPELRKMIDDSLQGEDVNFETDVKPLLGDRAAIAALNVPNAAGLQELTRRGRRAPAPRPRTRPTTPSSSASWTSPTARTTPSRRCWSRSGATKAGEHDGVDLLHQATDDDTVAAVTDGALVVTDTQPAALRGARRAPGGRRQDPRRHDQVHRRARQAPGRRLRPGLHRRRRASCARRHRPAPAARAARPLEDYQNAVVAASLAAEPDGVRVKGVVVGAPDVRRRGEFSPDPRRPAPRPTPSPTSASTTWPAADHDVLDQAQGGPGRGAAAAVRRASPPSSRCSSASRSTTSRRSPPASTPSWSPAAAQARARPSR